MREDGATMVEYGLILAVIAVIAVAGAIIVGDNTNVKFEEVGTCIEANGC